MSTQELIKKAQEELQSFHKNFKDKEPNLASPDELPNVRVRETVTIYFTSESRDACFRVYLDRETGEIVGAEYAPG